MLNGVYAAVDSKRAPLFVALDLSADFDTIRHSLLLSRLQTDYGVHSTVLSWLESYLTGRQQFVKLGRHSSASSPCVHRRRATRHCSGAAAVHRLCSTNRTRHRVVQFRFYTLTSVCVRALPGGHF